MANVRYDVVFITYGESNKEENWANLCKYVEKPKRVDDVDGIVYAHKEAARLVDTPMFFVVDGDCEIFESPFWPLIPTNDDFMMTHVWPSINPVNGLVYGYGGIKMFPTSLVLEADPEKIVDFTTSIGIGYRRYVQPMSYTRFNATPLEAWRGAFREVAKLKSKYLRDPDPETNNRIVTWLNMAHDVENSSWALKGAWDGFGKILEDPDFIRQVNDYKKLNEIFHEKYS